MWPMTKKLNFSFGTTHAVVRLRRIILNGKKVSKPHVVFFKSSRDNNGKRSYRTEFQAQDLPELRVLVDEIYDSLTRDLNPRD